MTRALGVVAGLLVLASASAAGEAGEARVLTSYSLGHQIGTDLVQHGRRVDLESVARGLGDGLEGAEPAYPAAEIDALLGALEREIVASERMARFGDATLRERGRAFLAENAKREGVVQRPSGLQYRVVREGAGPRPDAGDSVLVRYRSTRLDGVAFHDSLRPDQASETLRIEAMIPGLREALPLLPVGSRVEIVLPPELAFARRGPLSDQTVIYDLELIAIVPGQRAAGGVP